MDSKEQIQSQIDANTVLLIAITTLLKDDPRLPVIIKASFEGFVATRLNHSVSQEYLDQLSAALVARLPQQLKELIR